MLFGSGRLAGFDVPEPAQLRVAIALIFQTEFVGINDITVYNFFGVRTPTKTNAVTKYPLFQKLLPEVAQNSLTPFNVAICVSV